MAFAAVSSAAAAGGGLDFDGRLTGNIALSEILSGAAVPPVPEARQAGTFNAGGPLLEKVAPGYFRPPSVSRAAAGELSPEQRVSEFLFITSKLESVYSHMESKQAIYGFSYEALKAQYLARVRACGDTAGYQAAVTGFLDAFHDPHLRAFFYDSMPPQGPQPPAVVNTLTEDGILVTRLSRLYGDAAEITGGLAQSLEMAKTAKALVVDIRGNPGGNDGYAYDYISKLVAHTVPTGKVTIKISSEALAQYGRLDEDPKRPGWTPWYSGEIAPKTQESFKGPIAVLIDGGCVSSCEGTAVAFKFSGAAKLYGARTMGSSGYPATIKLPFSNGAVRVPTWINLMPDDTPIEDHGVYPDVQVAPPGDALAAALAAIRS